MARSTDPPHAIIAGLRRVHAGLSSPWVLPPLIFAFVAVYRFNALGGSFGGFDNDHFLHFVYAKQVESGQQPLRDFLDGGLQGAWPSLTYELSAAAQLWFGDTLLPEAVLTVGAMALAAAVTLLAALRVAPWPMALLTTLLSVLVSPKLYNYPKVFILASAAWLIVSYAAHPRKRTLVAMAVASTIAFLFRHDYAVYCALGFSAVIAATHGRAWRTSAHRLVVVGVLALALATPSLLWIQRHVGILPYLRTAAQLSAAEDGRTRSSWPAFSQVQRPLAEWLGTRENAEAWLYYLCIALPIVALVGAGVQGVRGRGRGESPAWIALGVLSLALVRAFLRNNLEGRFGDMSPIVAVLAASLLAGAIRWRSGTSVPAYALRLGLAVALTVPTMSAIWSTGSVTRELYTTGIAESLAVAGRRTTRVASELAGLPSSIVEAESLSPRMEVARYLATCTRPSEQVLVASYMPEILAFADRRFAGGRATVIPRFYVDEQSTAITIARLTREPPSLVLEEPAYLDSFQELSNYIRANYDERGTLELDDERVLHVFARKGLVTTVYRDSGMPCTR